MLQAMAVLLSAGLAQPPASLPPHWTAALAPPGRAALDAALHKPPKGLPSDSDLAEVDENGNEKPIRTCADYVRAKKDGWGPKNTYEMAMESWFIQGCSAVSLMLKAKPSKASYVATIKLDDAALDILPPAVASAFAEGPALRRAETLGRSARQFNPRIKTIRDLSHQGSLVLEDASYRYEIDLLGYGDFNGDGLEDLLLFESTYAKRGSLHAYEPVIVTRTTPSGVLSTVKAK